MSWGSAKGRLGRGLPLILNVANVEECWGGGRWQGRLHDGIRRVSVALFIMGDISQSHIRVSTPPHQKRHEFTVWLRELSQSAYSRSAILGSISDWAMVT